MGLEAVFKQGSVAMKDFVFIGIEVCKFPEGLGFGRLRFGGGVDTVEILIPCIPQ